MIISRSAKKQMVIVRIIMVKKPTINGTREQHIYVHTTLNGNGRLNKIHETQNTQIPSRPRLITHKLALEFLE